MKQEDVTIVGSAGSPQRRRLRGALSAALVVGLLLAATALPAGGGLTQKPSPEVCISSHGRAGCVNGTALDRAFSVAVSPNGANAYVAAQRSAAVAVFDRKG